MTSGVTKLIKLGKVEGCNYTSSAKLPGSQKKVAGLKIALVVDPQESQDMDKSFNEEHKIYLLKEANFVDLGTGQHGDGKVTCEKDLLNLYGKRKQNQYKHGKWFAQWMKQRVTQTDVPSEEIQSLEQVAVSGSDYEGEDEEEEEEPLPRVFTTTPKSAVPTVEKENQRSSAGLHYNTI